MKTGRFKELINGYGFEVVENGDTFFVMKDSWTYATVSRKRMFEMNTSYERFEQMEDKRIKNAVYNCCDSFCRTPLDERPDNWNKVVEEWISIAGTN